MSTQPYIGTPTRRIDGPLKVTGQAKYAAEYNLPGLLHGYIVASKIAKGRVTGIDSSAAETIPGFVKIYTHENRPELSDKAMDYNDQTAPPGEHYKPLASDQVLFSQQPVALVVAESFEAARDAASLVKVTYAAETPETDLHKAKHEAYDPPKKRDGITPPPKPRGDFAEAFALAPVRFEADYESPIEHHNAMEPHASTCIWNGEGSITVYDKTQGSQNCQQWVMNIFDLKKDQVRIVNSYVGGGFGSGLRPHYQLFFAVMAARELGRSVRVELPREQNFALVHRPHTLETVKFGATQNGKLQAIGHDAIAGTSTFEDHQEVVVNWTGLMYQAPNVLLTHKLAKLDTPSPGDMRAPGAVIGQFASECAVDELAHELKLDPIEFRLRNYTTRDENDDKDFTSKALREAFKVGAEAFGWSKRTPEPRSMRQGKELIGYGVAWAAWEALVQKTAASVSLDKDGFLTVASATSDIGTGSYTIMGQTGADALGLPLECVHVRLGDSDLPEAPVEGGSWGAASTCSAILDAAETLKEKLVSEAHGMDGRPIGHATLDDVTFANGRITVTKDPSKSVSLIDVLRSTGKDELTAEGAMKPSMLTQMRYVSYTHSAIFCEVRVDEELGQVRVTRIVDAVAAGKILNPKTARSQILGGIVMALGAALEEETFLDHKLGRFMNHNLAEYHVPVNADIENIEVIFVHEEDEKASPIGAKGLGEIGIVGTGAAIANAIFHATGRRIRTLPITIDKVLGLDAQSHTVRNRMHLDSQGATA
ncbi:MAG TPA: xanthine dehydrogenase family protein molybdopterin-binding subunit [Acidobacteriaceae bacterium]|nr:xanthine dehydrogenase family protein molybdopterin-binding subunit [Acidobacteriaceae bacterium]